MHTWDDFAELTQSDPLACTAYHTGIANGWSGKQILLEYALAAHHANERLHQCLLHEINTRNKPIVVVTGGSTQ